MDDAHAVAQRLGREAGAAAAGLLLDGTSIKAKARRLVDAIKGGDTSIMDAVPPSGEGMTPDAVIRAVEAEGELEVGDDGRDDVLRAFEDAYREGVEAQAVRSARALLRG